MKISSIIFTTFTLMVSVVTIGCNSAEKENKNTSESYTTDVVSVEYQSEKVDTSTRQNSKRLSEKAMASYLPASIGTFIKSGSPKFKEADPKLGLIYTRMKQSYYGDEGTIGVMITDFADDQKHINEMQKGMQYDDFHFSKTHQNEKGWYITESFGFRADAGKDTVVASRTLNINNPRIDLELTVSPPLEGAAPPAEYLMQAFENSRFPILFELPIPQGEAKEIEKISTLIALDCDEILPISLVSSVCGVSGIDVFAGDFEKENNCNREYADKGNLGTLILIVSQYEEAGMGNSAIKYHLSDNQIASKKIDSLGEAAVLQTVGDDLFLSIAIGKFLVELRAFKNDLDRPEKCCVCSSEAQLKTLAEQVISRLPN